MSKDYQRLDANVVERAVTQLDGWKLRDNKLHKEFEFKNFVEAFGFITQVALRAQQIGHHPDIFSTYDRVALTLWTHSAGAVTSQDIELAELIDKL